MAVLLLPKVWGSDHPPHSYSQSCWVGPQGHLHSVPAAAFPEQSSSWSYAGDTSSSWGNRSFVPEKGSGVGGLRRENAVLCLLAQSHLTLCNPTDHSRPGSSGHGDCPGKRPGVGCHALLQEVFLPENTCVQIPWERGPLPAPSCSVPVAGQGTHVGVV